MPNFDDVLNTKAEDIVKLPPKPAGTYLASVAKFPEQITRTVQGEERSILSFQVKLLAPQEGVSQDELANQPEVSSWAPMKHDVWLDDLNPLKRFLTDVLGIQGGDRTIKEMLAETPGKTFLATVEHKGFTNKDGQPDIAANITKTAAA